MKMMKRWNISWKNGGFLLTKDQRRDKDSLTLLLSYRSIMSNIIGGIKSFFIRSPRKKKPSVKKKI